MGSKRANIFLSNNQQIPFISFLSPSAFRWAKFQFLPLLCVLLLFPNFSKGQLVFTDTGEETSLNEIIRMFSTAKLVVQDRVSHNQNSDLHILEIQDEKFMLLNGHFDVYHWMNNQWVNLYKGNLSGYNFGSKKFVSGNKIYCYGGYGFWNLHGELIQFDLEKGDWDIVPSTQKLVGGLGILMEYNQKIQVYSEGVRYTISIPDGKISPPEKPIHQTLDKLSRAGGTYSNTCETDSFFLLDRGSIQYLFTKKDLKVYENSTGDGLLDRMNNYDAYIQIRGNDFRLIDTLTGNVDTLTHAQVYQLFNVQETNSTIDTESTNNLPFVWPLLIILLTTGALYAVFRLKRKKPKPQRQQDHPMVVRLSGFKGLQITTEQLDEILEIKHIKLNETQRYRRSQLIKQINEGHQDKYGIPLITRIQDPEDGRKFLYRIG